MSRVIFKYNANIIGVLSIPENHKFLKVDIQDDKITFWIDVDLTSDVKEYPIAVIGTGREYKGELPRHLGTIFQGPFVWHIFGDLK